MRLVDEMVGYTLISESGQALTFGVGEYVAIPSSTVPIDAVKQYRDALMIAFRSGEVWSSKDGFLVFGATAGSHFRVGYHVFTGNTVRASSAGRVDLLGDEPSSDSVFSLGVDAADITDVEFCPRGKGFWVLGADGGVFTFGQTHFHGSLSGLISDRAVAIFPLGVDEGYEIATSDGDVYSCREGKIQRTVHSNIKYVACSCIRLSDVNYLFVSRDGLVFCEGSLTWLGSMALDNGKCDPVIGAVPHSIQRALVAQA